MSLRLFHRGARVVLKLPGRDGMQAWLAVHRRPVAWERVLSPALVLVGITAERAEGGLSFAGGGVRWTTGWFWTTIRVQLPPCSPKKAALLATGLLKAARYAAEPHTTASDTIEPNDSGAHHA